jgi:hypothetical protein
MSDPAVMINRALAATLVETHPTLAATLDQLIALDVSPDRLAEQVRGAFRDAADSLLCGCALAYVADAFARKAEQNAIGEEFEREGIDPDEEAARMERGQEEELR